MQYTFQVCPFWCLWEHDCKEVLLPVTIIKEISYLLIQKFHWSKPRWETLKNTGAHGRRREGRAVWAGTAFPGTLRLCPETPLLLPPCLMAPLSCRRTGAGPSALLLREVLGALWHPGPAHAPGRTHAAAPPALCQHHVQFHGHVEVSALVRGVPWRSRGSVHFKGLGSPSSLCPALKPQLALQFLH